MLTNDATNPVGDEDITVLDDDQGVDQTDDQIDTTEADDKDSLEGEETDEPAEEEFEEIKRGDQKYKIPKALKGEFLMQADYTRKTQEHASTVRDHQARVAQWEQDNEALVTARAIKTNIDSRLKQIDGLTDQQWAQLEATNPQEAMRLTREAARLRDQRAEVDGAVADHTSRMAEEQKREHANLRSAMFEEVQQKVPDWTDQLGDEVANFAVQEFGVSPQALRNLTDAPSLLILVEAFKGRKAIKELEQAKKVARAQKTAPAKTVRGQGGRFDIAPDTSDFSAFEKRYGGGA